MRDRVILHSDMNSFYASVEMMLDPSLRGKAVAVCGDAENRHGIVLAKSDKAKKAGVKTGMVNWQAKQLCPELLLVPPHYDQYLKYSRLAHQIYSRYTDLIEPFGMDECWLDVTANREPGLRIAEEISAAVKFELGLTVSIGVSFNKIFAKLGSDMKKPDAITCISREDFREKVWPLDASELIYVGRATSRRLAGYGIHTIGQLAATDPRLLRSWFGVNGLKLWSYADGSDMSRVTPMGYVSPVKSIGHGVTCRCDLTNEEQVFKVMLELSQDVGHRLRLHNLTAAGIQLFVRGKDLNYDQYQCRLPCRSRIPSDIAGAAFRLFRGRYRWSQPVRALTVRAAQLVPEDQPEQLSLFTDNKKQEKKERLQKAVEEIRDRFGKDSLTYAVLMGDLKMPMDGRDKVKMPSLMYS